MDKFVDANAKSFKKSQISAIIMDRKGAILAMSGGKDYQKSQYNRAVLAKRQAGSIFKTFVYLAAFEEGFTPEDVFEDKKINISKFLC
jgi:membrane peptidoglycan carboxypeptidase